MRLLFPLVAHADRHLRQYQTLEAWESHLALQREVRTLYYGRSRGEWINVSTVRNNDKRVSEQKKKAKMILQVWREREKETWKQQNNDEQVNNKCERQNQSDRKHKASKWAKKKKSVWVSSDRCWLLEQAGCTYGCPHHQHTYTHAHKHICTHSFYGLLHYWWGFSQL